MSRNGDASTEANPATPAPPATDPTAIGPPPPGAEITPDGEVSSGLPDRAPSPEDPPPEEE
ncbi:hypothetical protein [Methylobacterium variabile]|jgi:hypothetical protein|nr:hypothetical protein [Methylobacterium variabile]